MTFAQLDFIADAVIPLLALGVTAGALWVQRMAAWNFLLRGLVATLLVQQSAKFVQKLAPLGHEFPSTHFAVALCLAVFLALLHRKIIPVAVAVIVVYAPLMLWQGYHTPLEMAGALYAVPVALFFALFKRRARAEATRN